MSPYSLGAPCRKCANTPLPGNFLLGTSSFQPRFSQTRFFLTRLSRDRFCAPPYPPPVDRWRFACENHLSLSTAGTPEVASVGSLLGARQHQRAPSLGSAICESAFQSVDPSRQPDGSWRAERIPDHSKQFALLAAAGNFTDSSDT